MPIRLSEGVIVSSRSRCLASIAVMILAFASALVLASTSFGQAPAILRGPYLQCGTPTAITICWRTDVPSTAVVAWREAGSSTWIETTPSGLATDHVVTLTGLAPGTHYEYRLGDGTAWLSSGHGFKSAPPTGSRPPTRIWVLGDAGTANPFAGKVRNAYAEFAEARHTDLWLMLGDNALPAGTDAQFQAALFGKFGTMLRQSVLWPTYGNHDAISSDAITQTGPYFDIFHLPAAGEAGGMPSGTEAWYSFDWANVHFICLDSSESDRSFSGPMMSWLQVDAASTIQDWTIAFWHHPPYSKGIHDSDAEQAMVDMRERAVPILESLGVDLILCGHNHLYERSLLLDGHYGPSTTFDPALHAVDAGRGRGSGTRAYRKPTLGPAPHEGTVCVVAGSSGHLTPGPLGHPVMVASMLELGSLVIDVHGAQLDCRFLDDEGRVRDHFTLGKGGIETIPWDRLALGPQSAWHIEDSGTDLGPTWKDPGYDDSAWRVGRGTMGHGEQVITCPVALDPTGAVPPTLYFRGRFELPGAPSAVERMRFAVGYDDGFVAWLNGIEVIRRNMPQGPVAFATPALGNIEYWWKPYRLVDISGSLTSLVSDINVFAVELHQAPSGTNDALLAVEFSYEGFFPELGSSATGTVGVATTGAPVDLLRINGCAGGPNRSFLFEPQQPFVLSVDHPPANPLPADFAIFGTIGVPGLSDTWAGPGQEILCFTPAFSSSGPANAFVLAASNGSLSHCWISSDPAPWSLTLPRGLGQPRTFTLQGLIWDTPTTLASTNAVILRVAH